MERRVSLEQLECLDSLVLPDLSDIKGRWVRMDTWVHRDPMVHRAQPDFEDLRDSLVQGDLRDGPERPVTRDRLGLGAQLEVPERLDQQAVLAAVVLRDFLVPKE